MGIGPLFACISVLYGCSILFISHVLYKQSFCIYSALFSPIIGIVLILLGTYVFIRAIKEIIKCLISQNLNTEGIYSLMRHPLYGSWIVFIVPGIVILSGGILDFTIPIFMYIIFKILIVKEETYLRKRFGIRYSIYKKRVHQIQPTRPLAFLNSILSKYISYNVFIKKIYFIKTQIANLQNNLKKRNIHTKVLLCIYLFIVSSIFNLYVSFFFFISILIYFYICDRSYFYIFIYLLIPLVFVSFLLIFRSTEIITYIEIFRIKHLFFYKEDLLFYLKVILYYSLFINIILLFFSLSSEKDLYFFYSERERIKKLFVLFHIYILSVAKRIRKVSKRSIYAQANLKKFIQFIKGYTIFYKELSTLIKKRKMFILKKTLALKQARWTKIDFIISFVSLFIILGRLTCILISFFYKTQQSF